MLDIVRSKQKSVLIKIAFVIIILSFVIGYTMLSAPTDQASGRGQDVAARINGQPISYGAYQSAYSALYNLYQNIYQESFDANLERQLNLPRQAMQQLIEEQLLVQLADDLNLSVSKQELVSSIAAYDAFQINGQFNRDRYVEVLNYQRMSPEQFENAQRRELLAQKVRNHLQQNVTIDQDEIINAFHEENDQISLDFVWLTPALVESKVEVTQEALQQFFDDNREQFRIPERVSLRYLQFDPQRYEDQITTFTDEEIDRFYRRNLELFEVDEQVKASHILLKLDEDADEKTVEQRRDLAQDILKQLRDGADFAQLARLHSDDSSNASDGGDLGRFGRGVMAPEFEAAAFALRPGQISDVTRTPFGFHIIRVDEYIQQGFKPLVDVIDTVKAGLIVEKSRQLAYEKAMDAYNINRRTGDLEAAAQANDLGIKETGLFAKGEPINGFGRTPEIEAAAFALKEEELARPIQTTQGVLLLALKQREPSRLPELSEVKTTVESRYRAQRAQTLAHELATNLLALAKELNSLPQAAEELDLKLETTDDFSRTFGYFIPQIGSSQALSDAAFELTPDAPVAPDVYTIDSKYLVAALNEATPADFSSLDETQLSRLRERLLEEKKEQAVSDKLDELFDEAQIEIVAPELVTAFND